MGATQVAARSSSLRSEDKPETFPFFALNQLAKVEACSGLQSTTLLYPNAAEWSSVPSRGICESRARGQWLASSSSPRRCGTDGMGRDCGMLRHAAALSPLGDRD